MPITASRHPGARVPRGFIAGVSILGLAIVAPAQAATPALYRGVVNITSTLASGSGTAYGTGMRIAPGVVLTNNHVIEGASAIAITDVVTRRRYRATVAGYDLRDDVAVLRLTAVASAPRVTLGDSSTVAAGDTVTAVGNAGGRGTPTVATGSVTALRRSIQVEDREAGRVESLTGLIEVDAQLEAGESGGPLFNSLTRVVGMNTATSVGFTAAQTTAGRGYAIPINKAMGIVRAVLAKRGSSRIHVGATARLGVAVQTVQTPWAPSGVGVPVVAVSDGTPAAAAGIVAGDAITAVDGTAVTTASAISTVMFVHHPGDVVSVTWTTAAGESRSANVTLASGPPA